MIALDDKQAIRWVSVIVVESAAAVEAFRADHLNTHFSVDDLAMADGKAFLTNQMWQIPEDAPEGAEGEPASPQLLTVLGIKDGKITERWLYTLLEP